MDFEGEQDEQDDDEEEWKSDTLAGSCVIRCRRLSGTTYFTKGKLNDIGHFIKDNEDVNVVYVNTILTSMQQKKLEKRFNDIIQGRDSRLRRYYLKSVSKDNYFSPTEVDSETETDFSSYEGESLKEISSIERRVRVIDRFAIIMQIFAMRAKTRVSQIQIELAWLSYARSLMSRGGAPTFGRLGQMFEGNLMKQELVQVETKSAKGTKASGSVAGSGETQIEIER